MDGTGANWWMDERKRWHRGRPPTGWWESENRRWHPPAARAEVEYRPPTSPSNFGRGARSPKRVTRRRH